MNVLITGVGGPAGINVLREVARLGHTTIGVDCDPMAAGFHIAHRSELVPPCSSRDYRSVLVSLLDAHEVDVVIATVTEELALLDDITADLSALGVGHWGPSRRTIELCSDKLLFAKTLESHGVATPATDTKSTPRVPGPWIVKPRDGRGSRDVHSVTTRGQVKAALQLVPNPLVQTRVMGREFSADVLTGGNSRVIGMAARWRDACRGGISTAGTTFVDSAVDEAVRRAVRVVELSGPANVQGFVTAEGDVWIIEINPRFSGGLPLSLASGCDLVGQFLRGATGQQVEATRLQSTPGVSMARVFDEFFVGLPKSSAPETAV